MWSYFSTFLVTVQRGIRSRYSLSAGVGSNQKVVFSVKNSNFKKDTYFWGPNFKKSHKISIQNARLNLEIISFTTELGPGFFFQLWRPMIISSKAEHQALKNTTKMTTKKRLSLGMTFMLLLTSGAPMFPELNSVHRITGAAFMFKAEYSASVAVFTMFLGDVAVVHARDPGVVQWWGWGVSIQVEVAKWWQWQPPQRHYPATSWGGWGGQKKAGRTSQRGFQWSTGISWCRRGWCGSSLGCSMQSGPSFALCLRSCTFASAATSSWSRGSRIGRWSCWNRRSRSRWIKLDLKLGYHLAIPCGECQRSPTSSLFCLPKQLQQLTFHFMLRIWTKEMAEPKKHVLSLSWSTSISIHV